MFPPTRSKKYTRYILPLLFCGLIAALVLLRGQPKEAAVKDVLQATKPLTLTEAALENYLFSAGFILDGEAVLNEDGTRAATLQVQRDGDDIASMTLAFPLPTYVETEDAPAALASLKAKRDEGAQRGEDMFLALFDAIAVTDGRVEVRRDNALLKLRKTMDTGKAATQSANTWQFAFSLEPGLLEGTVTVRFEKVR